MPARSSRHRVTAPRPCPAATPPVSTTTARSPTRRRWTTPCMIRRCTRRRSSTPQYMTHQYTTARCTTRHCTTTQSTKPCTPIRVWMPISGSNAVLRGLDLDADVHLVDASPQNRVRDEPPGMPPIALDDRVVYGSGFLLG